MATRGILQRDLAAALDLSQNQVSERIRGAIDWRLRELRIVAALVKVDPVDLFNAPDTTPAADQPEPAAATS